MATEQTLEWAGPALNHSDACRVHAAEVGLQWGQPQISFLGTHFLREPWGPVPSHSFPCSFFPISSFSPLLISQSFLSREILGQHQPSPAESCQSLQLWAFILVSKWSHFSSN